jgi:RNA polymerase sigma factor (TIGR02999 family)
LHSPHPRHGSARDLLTLLDTAGAETTPAVAEKLLPLVYDELRRLAAAKLALEAPGQTLQATALVHEAWLKLAGRKARDRAWNGRGHFFAAAAEVMRHILTDNARRKKAARHGGGLQRADTDDSLLRIAAHDGKDEELLAVHEAVDKLAAHDARKAELVKLRYFAGLSIEEASEALGISPATAKRDWTYARAWLFGEIHGQLRGPAAEQNL